MSTKTAPVATLKVSRLIKAPRERVFAVWTDPKQLGYWFGPETVKIVSASMDVRVGGEYRVKVQGTNCDGSAPATPDQMKELTGTYREIKRPERLVYTWAWEPREEFGESVVTVDFLDKEGFTEVQVKHDLLPDDEQREKHGYGWNVCLERLAAAVGDAGSCSEPGAFCWNEYLAADPAKATQFYTQLFGWSAEKFPGPMDYTVFTQDGKKISGLMQRPCETAPPSWLAYVEVKDVDTSVKQAAQLGAEILMEPKDIPTVGRLAVFKDPQGAPLGIFQPARK